MEGHIPVVHNQRAILSEDFDALLIRGLHSVAVEGSQNAALVL